MSFNSKEIVNQKEELLKYFGNLKDKTLIEQCHKIIELYGKDTLASQFAENVLKTLETKE